MIMYLWYTCTVLILSTGLYLVSSKTVDLGTVNNETTMIELPLVFDGDLIMLSQNPGPLWYSVIRR